MKQSLILLHGAVGSKNQFEKLESLLLNTFNVHSFNFEGHGGRMASEKYSMDLFSQNLLQFMDENSLEKSHIFGYSMGGYVALVFAKEHPERINRIMTLGTKFDWTPESAEKETKMLNPEKIEAKVPRFAKMLEERHQPLDWKNVLNQTAQMMLDLGNGKAFTSNQFATIQNEVFITIGENDNMVTFEEGEAIANVLSNGTIKKIEGFPHPIEKVDFQKLAELIIEFFNA